MSNPTIEESDMERYEEIYRCAYWKAYDEKAANSLERGSIMHEWAHEAGLRAVIVAVIDGRNVDA